MSLPSIYLNVFSQQLQNQLKFNCILKYPLDETTEIKYSKIVSKGAKIRNRYNQVPHLTQDTNGKVTNSQMDTTNESHEVSPFPSR